MVRVKARTKERRRRFDKILRQYREFEGQQIDVFVPESSGSQGVSLATIAAANEFGTTSTLGNQHIPSRPFMRNAFDNNLRSINRFILQQNEKVADRRTSASQALRKIGEFHKSLVQKSITSLKDPGNDPATIAKKGSSNPLIDTGQLRQSISVRVQ